MSTSFSKPINVFMNMVEKDAEFFNYFNVDEAEASSIAVNRSKAYMTEAIGEITIKCSPTVDFYDVDLENELFNEDLNGKEIYLMASLMYERYLSRDIAKIKIQNVNFTETDLRVFDPSNARSTFLALYENVQKRNAELLEEYANRDRDSGQYKEADYFTEATGGDDA